MSEHEIQRVNPTVFQSDLKVKDEDVMKLATSRYAMKILQIERELEKQIKQQTEIVNKADAQMKGVFEKARSTKSTPAIKKVLEGLKVIGVGRGKFKPKFDVRVSAPPIDKSSEDPLVAVSIAISWGPSARHSERMEGGALNHDFLRPMTKEEKEAREGLKAAHERLRQLQQALMDAKGKKANFPLVSDMARAVVIERELSNLDPELLKKLDAISESEELKLPEIPALPAPKAKAKKKR